jgi:DNA-directed RNA polymerase specialized sigma24 family protein
VLLTRSRSDDELVAAGGPDGFALFYRRHVESILRYYVRSTRDPDVAADLTAEAFAAALAAKRRFRPGGAPASAWLFGIASRKLADYRRRGYAEDRARRRLGMQTIDPTDADLRWIERLAGDVEVVSLVEEAGRPWPGLASRTADE